MKSVSHLVEIKTPNYSDFLTSLNKAHLQTLVKQYEFLSNIHFLPDLEAGICLANDHLRNLSGQTFNNNAALLM